MSRIKMLAEHFRVELKNLRRKAKITQKTLADEVGVHHTYISKIESGKLPPPSEETLYKMAKVLNVDRFMFCRMAGVVPTEMLEVILDAGEFRRIRNSYFK